MWDLGAERKLVTVLTADIDTAAYGDFDELDPEDVGATFALLLDQIRAEITRAGGIIEHVVGSRVIAVFGVPSAREDDAERAVRAALAIRDAMTSGQESETPVRGGQPALAVATGEALVRPDGAERVSGDVVSACGRLAENTPLGVVLVTEATARATERTILYEAAGDSGTWRALEPRGLATLESEIGPASTSLIGRARELKVLEGALKSVRRTGQPQRVTLVGAPGLGKSRLVAEFGRRVVEVAPESVAWRVGRCHSYREDTVFGPLAEIVKAEAEIADTDTSRQVTRKLNEAARRALPGGDATAVAWVAQHLRLLVGGDRGHPVHAVGQRRESVAAWRRFLLGLATQRPLVLVFEDLHWAGDALLEFIDSLAAKQPRQPASLLVIATVRPQLLERHASQEGSLIELAPLPDKEIRRLLGVLTKRQQITGGPKSPVARDPELLARIGGNPFFAEEYVRALQQSGRNPSGPQPTPEESTPPTTVWSLIGATIDALRPAEKAVLQDAAVLGRRGWPGALAVVGEHDRRELDAVLAGLARKHLLRWRPDSTVAHEQEFEFDNVLVRDVAYAQLVRVARADKHYRAAQWFEAQSAVRPDDTQGPRGPGNGDRSDDELRQLSGHHYEQALIHLRAAGRDDPEWVERADRVLRGARMVSTPTPNRRAERAAYWAFELLHRSPRPALLPV